DRPRPRRREPRRRPYRRCEWKHPMNPQHPDRSFVTVTSEAAMPIHSRPKRAVLAALTAMLLTGCSAVDRFAEIGSPPALSAIENPTTQAGYRPVHMPMPDPMPAAYNPNSLWRSGSRAFFKDQRAHQVGDIL